MSASGKKDYLGGKSGSHSGALALCMHEVMGSIPTLSTPAHTDIDRQTEAKGEGEGETQKQRGQRQRNRKGKLHLTLRNSTHASCLAFPAWVGVSAGPDLSLHTVVCLP